MEYLRYRGVVLLLTAKICAVLFLTTMMIVEPAPWAVPFSAIADGLMALVVYLVHRKA